MEKELQSWHDWDAWKKFFESETAKLFEAITFELIEQGMSASYIAMIEPHLRKTLDSFCLSESVNFINTLDKKRQFLVGHFLLHEHIIKRILD